MFTLIRFIGRSLLAAPFVLLGWDAAQEPGGRADKAAAIGVPQPDLAVRVNGYTMVGGGIALALGILPRWAAAAIAGTLIPTTIAGHPFWKDTEPKQRQANYINFLKNVSMFGGMLVIISGRKP